LTEILDIGDLKLCVSREHRFGTDAVKLAEFTASGLRKSKKAKIVCDLCTGCGIIPFLLIAGFVKSGDFPAACPTIYALDINEDAIILLRESVKINSLDKVIFPLLQDLKSISAIPAGGVDIVTVNPPYYKADDGFKRKDGGTARHELLCDIDDVAAAAARILKYGGRLKMCHIPERLTDVVYALRKHNLEPKIIEFVANNKKEPWLMLIDAKKGGKPGMIIKLTIDD